LFLAGWLAAGTSHSHNTSHSAITGYFKAPRVLGISLPGPQLVVVWTCLKWLKVVFHDQVHLQTCQLRPHLLHNNHWQVERFTQWFQDASINIHACSSYTKMPSLFVAVEVDAKLRAPRQARGGKDKKHNSKAENDL